MHTAIEASVKKTREALGILATVSPMIEGLREHLEIIVGESNNPPAQKTMSILTGITEGSNDIPEILDTAITSANSLAQEI